MDDDVQVDIQTLMVDFEEQSVLETTRLRNEVDYTKKNHRNPRVIVFHQSTLFCT